MCRHDAWPLSRRHGKGHIPVRNFQHMTPMRRPARKVLTTILALFIFPLAVYAALYAGKDRPASFRDADWSSVGMLPDRKSTRLNSSHSQISYAVFCLKKKNK